MTPIVVEETGTVVQVGEGYVVVEVIKTSACQSCKAKQGCGQAVLSQIGSETKQAAKNHFRIPYPESIRVGSQVVLEMSAEVVSKVALLVYILPLFVGFLGLWFGSRLQWPESAQLILFISLLLGTYWALGRLSIFQSQVLTPRLKKVILHAPDLIHTQAEQSR